MKHNKKLSERVDKSLLCTVKRNGKDIGDLELYQESPDSINVVWLMIEKGNEGHGFGTAAMKATIKYAKETSCKQVTLEVPGNSPNARHIYEKLGFKDTGESILGDEDDYWGGLTRMRLDL